jgi:hypothetical protein
MLDRVDFWGTDQTKTACATRSSRYAWLVRFRITTRKQVGPNLEFREWAQRGGICRINARWLKFRVYTQRIGSGM